jgi:hypothetical protein
MTEIDCQFDSLGICLPEEKADSFGSPTADSFQFHIKIGFLWLKYRS